MTNEQEMKRSKIWNFAMSGSSILIVVIVAFFLIKMFQTNPLEGTWHSEEDDMVLDISSKQVTVTTCLDALDGEAISVKLDYEIDKDLKIFTINEDEVSCQKAVEKYGEDLTEEMVKASVSPVINSFDYSVDKDQLTLTDREYGEQLVFVKE